MNKHANKKYDQQFGVRLPASLIKKIKSAAFAREMRIKDLVKEVLEVGLANSRKKEP